MNLSKIDLPAAWHEIIGAPRDNYTRTLDGRNSLAEGVLLCDNITTTTNACECRFVVTRYDTAHRSVTANVPSSVVAMIDLTNNQKSLRRLLVAGNNAVVRRAEPTHRGMCDCANKSNLHAARFAVTKTARRRHCVVVVVLPTRLPGNGLPHRRSVGRSSVTSTRNRANTIQTTHSCTHMRAHITFLAIRKTTVGAFCCVAPAAQLEKPMRYVYFVCIAYAYHVMPQLIATKQC